MTKRGTDAEMEGPSAKSRREEADDGGSGRTGRVRKKSAKVLEMEEFEQVEKTQHVGKKSKAFKTAQKSANAEEKDAELAEVVEPVLKSKAKASKTSTSPAVPKLSLAASLMQAPITVTPSSNKNSKSSSSTKVQGLNSKPVSQFVPVQSSGILMTSPNSDKTSTQMLAEAIKKENQDAAEDSGKGKPSQSVIKYLLNSPSASSKASDSGSELVGGGGKKTSSKKSKAVHEKALSGSSVKSKSAKMKLDLGSDDDAEETTGSRASLKMLISTGSNPQSAHVTMNPNDPNATVKGKKASKKKTVVSVKSEPDEEAEKSTKKISKKKQKLIEEAILAAQSPSPPDVSDLKASKKKKKVKLPEQASVGEVVKPQLEIDDAEEEANLVIADPEKKKKKTLKKKKSKDKSPSEPKPEEEKKMSKRAPTAYMLFCNFHRPAIVNENPGIEFAGISKKTGRVVADTFNKTEAAMEA